MTTTLLSEPLIDLVELGRNCKSAAGRPFATAIALMADGVIRRYVGEDELLGILRAFGINYVHSRGAHTHGAFPWGSIPILTVRSSLKVAPIFLQICCLPQS